MRKSGRPPGVADPRARFVYTPSASSPFQNPIAASRSGIGSDRIGPGSAPSGKPAAARPACRRRPFSASRARSSGRRSIASIPCATEATMEGGSDAVNM